MTTTTKRQGPPVPEEKYNSLVNTVGLYPPRPSNIQFHVVVTDVRMRWGHTDVLIRPLRGQGSQWVDATRVELIPERIT